MAVMPSSWEGNRRSRVAVAMCHRLQWASRAQSLRKGNEHSTYTPHWGIAHFTLKAKIIYKSRQTHNSDKPRPHAAVEAILAMFCFTVSSTICHFSTDISCSRPLPGEQHTAKTVSLLMKKLFDIHPCAYSSSSYQHVNF